jgi:regulator of replication initiation timing
MMIDNLKKAWDFVGNIVTIKNEAELNQIKIALHDIILNAQKDIESLRGTIQELTKENTRLKEWSEKDKHRYALVAVVEGAYAYQLKHDAMEQ